MQVSVESTNGLERRMTVEVPGERIDNEVNKRLQQLSRTTRMKGFRPGKVPMKVVAGQYGPQVRQEVLGEVMQSTFYEAITQEKLQPAGAPSIEPKQIEEGKNLEYIATFEVMPEITPASVDGVKVEKPKAEVTDADVDAMLDNLRKQRTDWAEADRAAANGDRVVIDFKGSIDGTPFQGGEGSNVPVTLGEGRMIAGFEEGMTGAKAGDELTIDVTFPEDYANKELAGKDAQFAITVHKVEEPKLPELNDEFANSFGITDGGVEGLRKEVRANMERELDQALRNKVKQQVMDKLVELNEIEVPQALIDNEAENLANQMRQQMHTPPGKEELPLDTSIFKDQAERRVTLGLILAEIIRANDLKADDERVKKEVETLASTYDSPDEVVKWYYADKRRLSEVESLVVEDQVVDWVLDQADVTEVDSTFDELMNRGQ